MRERVRAVRPRAGLHPPADEATIGVEAVCPYWSHTRKRETAPAADLKDIMERRGSAAPSGTGCASTISR